MARFKIVKTEDYERLKATAQYKGYYGDNDANEYFRAIESQLKGIKLPDITRMDRAQIKSAYETGASAMGVVNYIAENVGEVMRYLVLRDRKGNEVESHEVLDMLNRPNDRYTLRKFGTAWAVNKLLYGDAWVYMHTTKGKDRRREMYIIPSHRVETDSDGAVKPLKGIRLLGSTMTRDIPLEKVMESFDYNLDDTSFFGTSKIVAAARYLSVMDKGMGRQETSLENGGATHLITPKPDATGTVMPKDAAEIEKLANGGGSIGKKRALTFPVEVHQLGNTPVDLNILASHKEAVTALCFVYRLPVDLYYGQAKYENAKEAKKTIYEQNAIPMANEFGEDLIRYLGMDAEGYTLEVDTDRIEVLREKRSETLDMLSKMHASLNELREANGYERWKEDWADKPIMPTGVMFGNEFEVPDIDENEPPQTEEGDEDGEE